MTKVKNLSVKTLQFSFGIAVILHLLFSTNGFWGDVLKGTLDKYTNCFYYNNKIIMLADKNSEGGKFNHYFLEADLLKSKKTLFELNFDKEWWMEGASFLHNSGSKYAYILLNGPHIIYDYEKVIIDGKEHRRDLSYNNAMLARIDLTTYSVKYLKEVKAVNKSTPRGLKIVEGNMYYITDNNLYKVVPNRFRKDILIYEGYEGEHCYRDGAFCKFDFKEGKYIKLGKFNPGNYNTFEGLNYYYDDYMIFSDFDEETLVTSFYLSGYNGENITFLIKGENVKVEKNGEEYDAGQFGGFYGDIMLVNDGFKVEGINIHTKEKCLTFEYDTVRTSLGFLFCIDDKYYFNASGKGKYSDHQEGMMIFDENGKLVDEFTTRSLFFNNEEIIPWNIFHDAKEGG